jgi:hypothetical protein
MDKANTGLTTTPDAHEKPAEAADRLEQQADTLRDNLGGLVAELDHRRHAAARRYGKPAAISGIVLTVGVIAALVWRKLHRKRSAAFGVGMVLGRVLPRRKKGEPVKREPSVTKKVIGAAAAAAASIAARHLMSRLLPGPEPGKPAKAS